MSSFTKSEFPQSDFAITTSDNVSLYVHRTILEISSPFFKDRFSIPQPKSEYIIVDFEKAIVKVPEDAQTMRQVLSLVYPVRCESFLKSTSLASLIRILRTATKYHFDSAIARLSDLLIERITLNPSDSLIAFAAGSIYNLPDLYSAASTASLNLGMSQLVGVFSKKQSEGSSHQQQKQTNESVDRAYLDEFLKQLPFQAYQSLLQLHRQRFEDVKIIIETSDIRLTECRCKKNHHNAETFKKHASAEIDTSGPVSKVICSIEFALKVAPNFQDCICLSDFQRGSARDDINKIRERIDQLPRAISLSGD